LTASHTVTTSVANGKIANAIAGQNISAIVFMEMNVEAIA
jgi:hypothetical protein